VRALRQISSTYGFRQICPGYEGLRWLSASNAVVSDAGVVAPQTKGEGEPQSVSPKVERLLEEIVLLNMLEVKELSSGLKNRLGISDSMGGMGMGFSPAMMMMPGGGLPAGAPGGGGSTAAAEAEPVEEKTSFNIKLESFAPERKIEIIKEIRAITQLPLKEAKAVVDNAPKTVREGVSKEEAEQIRDKLTELGAKIVLE